MPDTFSTLRRTVNHLVLNCDLKKLPPEKLLPGKLPPEKTASRTCGEKLRSPHDVRAPCIKISKICGKKIWVKDIL